MLCNHLQNVVATTYIFRLQLSTFIFYNKQHAQEPFFTEEQLNNMSRENLIEIMKIMKEQSAKKDTEIQLLKDKQKELEFMNAMLSDRLALARRKQFGSSSEKYAEGYEQMITYLLLLVLDAFKAEKI